MSSTVPQWLAESGRRSAINGHPIANSGQQNRIDEQTEQSLHDFFDAMTNPDILSDARQFQNGTLRGCSPWKHTKNRIELLQGSAAYSDIAGLEGQRK